MYILKIIISKFGMFQSKIILLPIFYIFQNGFISASKHLYTALEGRAYFDEIIILTPDHWNQYCFTNKSHTFAVVDNSKIDFILEGNVHPIHGISTWTKQYGQCGENGDNIFINIKSLQEQSINFGKELVRNWAKYRYGVFDEHGFQNDVIYPKCYFNDSLHITGCSDLNLKDNGYVKLLECK